MSKDKPNINSSQKYENKEQSKRLTIIQNDNNCINEFSDNMEGNHIDISIQFTNEPVNLNIYKSKKNEYYTKKNNLKETIDNNNKCYSSTKKNKNSNNSLYKDLYEINNKLDNKKYNITKHHYSIDYQKHYGDEKKCPKCREMRKKGRKMEKEKGVFHAFNFKNYKTISKKAINQLKSLQLHKTQSNNKNINININHKSYNNKKNDLLSDD